MVPAEKRSQLTAVSFQVMQRLCACDEVRERVVGQVEAGKKAVSEGLVLQAGGRAVVLPSVTNLHDEAERYLTAAKLALSSIARLFLPLYGQAFDHRFHKIKKWLKESRGGNDPLLELLVKDDVWIKKLLDLRNVIEHPDDPLAPLTVKNFSLVDTDQGQGVAPPIWFLNGSPVAEVAVEMNVFSHNLLTLFEDILIMGLEANCRTPLCIVEIPESERRSECPVRFRLAMGFDLETG